MRSFGKRNGEENKNSGRSATADYEFGIKSAAMIAEYHLPALEDEQSMRMRGGYPRKNTNPPTPRSDEFDVTE